MLKGLKARIGLIMVGILALCGSMISIMNAFAESAVLDYRVNPIIVELDGTENTEVTIALKTKATFKMISLNGHFTLYNDYELDHAPVYIQAKSIRIPSESNLDTSKCDLDKYNGFFDCEFGSLEADGNQSEQNENIVEMTYKVFSDVPAGVYTLPISIHNIEGKKMDTGINVHEEAFDLYPQVIVQRTQRVIFKDENNQAITEINKTYGDPDFVITKSVSEGDGDIIDYFIDYDESDDGVVSILPGTDYIRVLKAGTAKICASVSGTELYLPTESCFTINVAPKEIWVKKLTIADKQYDGSDSVELDELIFYTFDSDHLPFNVDLDPSEYEISGLVVDDPNVGERTATVEISLTEEGHNYYRLEQTTYEVSVTISRGRLFDIYASFEPQVYDPDLEYQYLAFTFGSTLTDFIDVTLEEGVDYELSYGGNVIENDEFWLTDAGDYDITVSPLNGSSFIFDPFDVTFTIEQKEVESYDASVASKQYDRTTNAEVSYIWLSEENLVKDVDYEVESYFYDSAVGYQSGSIIITLINPNYYFYSEYPDDEYDYSEDYDHHSDHASIYFSDVEIAPRELTDENTYYDWSYPPYWELDTEGIHCFTYTGEEIEPWVTLSVSFDGSFPEDPLNGEEYIIEYEDDLINAGTKYLTLTGIGNFTGSIGPLPYRVVGVYVPIVDIVNPSYAVYTGEALEPEPEVTVEYNEETIVLPANSFTTMEHDDFINVGEYSYGIIPKEDSNYNFIPTELTFIINPYEITPSNISLSESTFKYSGASQTPSVTVTVGNTIIDEDDYYLEYSEDTIGNDESDTTVTVTVVAKDNTNIIGNASVTYTITPRDVLTISGIENNQQIMYTGSPVILDGNAMVEENLGGITADDLTVKWYASDGTTEIDQPTEIGLYQVVYSYEDTDYRGFLVINFEIIAPPTYDVIEGAEQTYVINEDSDATFKIDADYSLFENVGAVYVDEELVDPSNYSSWEGSTYIKLASEYLNTLAVGIHTLKVTFSDGGSATTTFEIVEPDDGDDEEDNNDDDNQEGDNEDEPAEEPDDNADDEDNGSNDSDNEESDDETEDDDQAAGLPIPNTGVFTPVSSSAIAIIDCFGIILVAVVIAHKTRR